MIAVNTGKKERESVSRREVRRGERRKKNTGTLSYQR
jgi:hypothetical protein